MFETLQTKIKLAKNGVCKKWRWKKMEFAKNRACKNWIAKNWVAKNWVVKNSGLPKKRILVKMQTTSPFYLIMPSSINFL